MDTSDDGPTGRQLLQRRQDPRINGGPLKRDTVRYNQVHSLHNMSARKAALMKASFMLRANSDLMHSKLGTARQHAQNMPTRHLPGRR